MRAVERERVDEDIAMHIFSVSAGLVGVCLTVIGILRLIVVTKSVGTLADDLLSLDAMLFLTACFLAYVALRKRGIRRIESVERAADVIFIVALLVMVFACAAITYAIL